MLDLGSFVFPDVCRLGPNMFLQTIKTGNVLNIMTNEQSYQ